jgi:hypothetical protein
MTTIADAITPYSQAAPTSVEVPIANRFPTPPSNFTFLTTPDLVLPIIGIAGYNAAGLQHEGSRMEPTKGQIWPR